MLECSPSLICLMMRRHITVLRFLLCLLPAVLQHLSAIPLSVRIMIELMLECLMVSFGKMFQTVTSKSPKKVQCTRLKSCLLLYPQTHATDKRSHYLSELRSNLSVAAVTTKKRCWRQTCPATTNFQLAALCISPLKVRVKLFCRSVSFNFTFF